MSALLQPDFLIVVVVGIAAGLERYTSLLDRFRRRSAAEAAAEIAIVNLALDRVSDENERLRRATDITPILETLDNVVTALDRHSQMTEKMFAKIADMNGSLRHHGEAMKALADKLVLDEAARGLLQAAADRPDRPV